MAQTSINIQPVKGGSEQHNKREKELDYTNKNLTYLNEYWETDRQSERRAAIEANYREKTGQKMQAKATPIREAVVVIQEDTTMQQLQELGRRMQERWGMECFQIAMHKDEGYHKAKEWKANLHAHMVFDWTNHGTGKSIKLNRNDMVELQTMTAEVLGMERGVSSDKKHLNAIQFKIEALEEQAKEISEEIDGLNISKQTKESLYLVFERIKGFLGQSAKDKQIKLLEGHKNALETKIKQQQEKFKTFRQQVEEAIKKQNEAYKQEIQKQNENHKQELQKKQNALDALRLSNQREAVVVKEAERKSNLLKWCTEAGIETLTTFRDLWQKGEALYSGTLKWGEWQTIAKDAKLTTDAKGKGLRVDNQPLSYWVTSHQQEGRSRKRGLTM